MNVEVNDEGYEYSFSYFTSDGALIGFDRKKFETEDNALNSLNYFERVMMGDRIIRLYRRDVGEWEEAP